MENDNTTRIKELETLLDQWNYSYRFEGKQIVPDSVYDSHLEELADLDPDNKRVVKVGETPPDDERKENLPLIMASMSKVKSYDELKAWMIKKGIPLNTILCITPKYDGLSILNDVKLSKAWTRGDGSIGQNSDPHFKDVMEKYSKDKIESFLLSYQYAPSVYTTGEALITKDVFQKKHSKTVLGDIDGFDNGRNRVSGLFNKYKKENKPAFNDVVYMRYGFYCGIDMDKSTQLDILNQYFNSPEVPYILQTVDNLNTEYLRGVFDNWSKMFEIDGLIIEVNDKNLRNSIDPERSTKDNPDVMNPGYARAYKASFEEVKETKVIGMEVEVSKMGFVIPVAVVEPVMLDGAEVTRVTCNNAKMVYELGIGKGSILKLCRSGMVIPYILDVVKKSNDFQLIPSTCPSCETILIWNDTNTHLMCTNDSCTDKKIKQITSFFDILDVKGVRETTFRQLYISGYDTIQKILAMSIDDFKKLERMGESKASNVYDAIQSKIQGISLSKLQHASGFFTDSASGFSLGSKKLVLLEKFTQRPSVSEVSKINGFSDSSALIYCSNYERFFEWMKTLPITIKKDEPFTATGNKCAGKTFIFTGVRRKELEILIQQEGGKVTDTISRNCTHLIMKVVGSGSNKEKKALEYGMTIWTVEQLESFLEFVKTN
jgi:DNA ligase (NAD+)